MALKAPQRENVSGYGVTALIPCDSVTHGFIIFHECNITFCGYFKLTSRARILYIIFLHGRKVYHSTLD